MDDSDSAGDENNYTYGLLAVCGALVFFGSFATPLRIKELEDANVNPIVLQSYFSTSVYVSSLLVLTYIPFQFSWWGWMGSGLWLSSSLMSFLAIRFCGMAIAQSTWSGGTIIVSFLWGSLIFDEDVKNVGLAIVGIFLLCLGILGVSVCNVQKPVELPQLLSFLYLLPVFVRPGESDSMSTTLLDAESINNKSKLEREFYDNSSQDSGIEGEGSEKSGRLFLLGVALAALMGLPNGSMVSFLGSLE